MSRLVFLLCRTRSSSSRPYISHSRLHYKREKSLSQLLSSRNLGSSVNVRSYFSSRRSHYSETRDVAEKPAVKKVTRIQPEEIGITGLEREEWEYLKRGRPYRLDDVLTGPFGTPENPVLVPSVFDSRIVGCMGGPGPLSHEILWHLVKKDKPLVCLECGQVFKLIPLEQWEAMQMGGAISQQQHQHTAPTPQETKSEHQQHEQHQHEASAHKD
jgi:hypothetical protein